jgi:hypothetical protein
MSRKSDRARFALDRIALLVEHQRMAGLLSACGVDCQACDAYIATHTGDQELAKRVAARWSGYVGGGHVPIESTICDGCLTGSPRKGGMCAACALRACAIEKNVETCGHCPDDGCATLEEFLRKIPAHREKLEQIRQKRRDG